MAHGFDISGKVAVITGASRGIGQAIARRYAEAGAKVVIASRKQDALDTVAESMRAEGHDVLPVAAHNSEKDALRALISRTVEAYGTVDILVNNAATNPHFGSLLEAEDSQWQKTFEVNVMGNVWLTRAFVAVLREQGKGGKIINVASINALRPGTFQGVYSLTKAAVVNLTQTLAMELGAEGIQVNAIAPGLVQTRFARALWENETLLQRVTERTPAGRIGQPDDIAGIALYLAAPASDFTTGQVFTVDGGITVPLL